METRDRLGGNKMNQTHYFHHAKEIKITRSEGLADGAFTTTIFIDPNDKSERIEIVITSEAPLKIDLSEITM